MLRAGRLAQRELGVELSPREEMYYRAAEALNAAAASYPRPRHSPIPLDSEGSSGIVLSEEPSSRTTDGVTQQAPADSRITNNGGINSGGTADVIDGGSRVRYTAFQKQCAALFEAHPDDENAAAYALLSLLVGHTMKCGHTLKLGSVEASLCSRAYEGPCLASLRNMHPACPTF